MRTLATLPKPVLILEAAGGIMLLLALLVLNGWIPVPVAVSHKSLATLLLLIGVLLMLPAAWLMMWRTAKAMAPQLFGNANKKDN
ncbi:DUF1418 family protein [[Erwinia] mediterraneensis]|uniref:DUF1418 family protein n=1 Tax=[Erwinia] mediterraneensis TaxID=2161819 RepID=UPI0010315825|nr:DUF1418 family protein [[Erwinia] mediterraneensis]